MSIFRLRLKYILFGVSVKFLCVWFLAFNRLDPFTQEEEFMREESDSRMPKAQDLSNRLQLRTHEVAEMAGVSLSHAKVWLKTGAVPSYKIQQMRFVWKQDLIDFILRYRNNPTDLAA